MRQLRTFFQAVYELFEDSGFSMAGSVAFSFVLALFPFCIFLAALAGYFGGEALARTAVDYLFQAVPEPVADLLAPEVRNVMGQSRFGLLTFGALIALFFATSAVESLRAALNTAYRERETKTYFTCLLQSAVFVLVSAGGMLAMAWGILVGPDLLRELKPQWLAWLGDQGWTSFFVRYGIIIGVVTAQLYAYHLWLAAGERSLRDVTPGVLLSIVLWILAAQLFASWLRISDYSKFYAGLTQVMTALVFFQVTAMIMILGAELNRGLAEVREKHRAGLILLGRDERVSRGERAPTQTLHETSPASAHRCSCCSASNDSYRRYQARGGHSVR
jgi:membrane protein